MSRPPKKGSIAVAVLTGFAALTMILWQLVPGFQNASVVFWGLALFLLVSATALAIRSRHQPRR